MGKGTGKFKAVQKHGVSEKGSVNEKGSGGFSPGGGSQCSGSETLGELVWQLSHDILIDDTIIRIKIKTALRNLVGWVTKDAQRAKGPLFLVEASPHQVNEYMNKERTESPNEDYGFPLSPTLPDLTFTGKSEKKGFSNFEGSFLELPRGENKTNPPVKKAWRREPTWQKRKNYRPVKEGGVEIFI